ncbi:unnamed protein product [Rotaria sp. Silwood2]|nr:unnamed protein product [Rotaria sp. Silwood2]
MLYKTEHVRGQDVIMVKIKMNKPTVLLSLSNELLLYHIFIYLHSTDLLHAFGQLYNRRLNVLLCAHIHHIDLSRIDTSVVSIDRCLSYLSSFENNTILSLRINLDHFDYRLSSIFPRLNRLDLQMTTVSEKVFEMITFTRLKTFSVTLTSEKPERIKGLVSFIWHPDSCLESLSTSNCFVLDKDDLFPISLRSLLINQNLTRLSVDLGHICFAILLMPFVPNLEYFELRLHSVYSTVSCFKFEFLQEQQWPTKVKLLRLIAYDQFMDTHCFCAFVKRFSLSLHHLSFYISIGYCFLMATRRKFERHLLDYLPHLKSIDFCVHSGLLSLEIDRRHAFDRWTRKQVVSIHHLYQYLTRFTIPFSFDRLEHVTNDFVDYHCNYPQSNVILSLPSILMISFRSNDKLNLALFSFIRKTCPSLRHLRFRWDCKLSDDLIQNTQLTLPTVTELYLGDVTSIDFPTLNRILTLTSNLKHLTARRSHITVINTVNNNDNVLGRIPKVTIVEYNSQMNNI